MAAFLVQDEARHVAFGRLALRDYYPELTQAERDEREEFAVEASWAMRDRFLAEELWERLGFPVDECVRHVLASELTRSFRGALFARIVPSMQEIGLWGPRIRKAYEEMGVLQYAETDLDALAERDRQIAEQFDAGREGVG